jgi:hypothetical protein
LSLDDQVIGYVSPPWAVDSRGVKVPTHYQLNGNQLTQVVDHASRNVTYPVVADPAIYLTHGLFTASWYFSRNLTSSLARGLARYQNESAAAIGVALTTACAPMSGPGAVLCGSVGLVFGGFAIDQLIEAAKRTACLRVRVVNFPPYTTPIGIHVDDSPSCKDR